MGKSGTIFGIFTLLIAIGALGVGIYQIMLPAGGTTIYCETKEEKFYIITSTYEVLPNLNITYTTTTGDSVLLEFSCQLSIELYGSSTKVSIKFEIDGLPPTPDTEIEAIVMDPHIYTYVPFIMRHHVESSSAGSHIVKVLIKIDDTGTTSFVDFCVLTATIY